MWQDSRTVECLGAEGCGKPDADYGGLNTVLRLDNQGLTLAMGIALRLEIDLEILYPRSHSPLDSSWAASISSATTRLAVLCSSEIAVGVA